MKASFVLLLLFTITLFSFAQTKVILLGTGTSNPDPEHAGSSVAILVNNNAYLIDFGAGIVRQAAKMTPQYGGKYPQRLQFVTWGVFSLI